MQINIPMNTWDNGTYSTHEPLAFRNQITNKLILGESVLDFSDGELKFTGDADSAAKVFLEYVSTQFSSLIISERNKEREFILNCLRTSEDNDIKTLVKGILG